MLRIICRNENSRNSEMIFRNEASSEEIYEWIKSNYRNIIEIQIEFHEKEEYCKTFVDTKGSIKATTNTEDSEATEARNSEKLSVQPEPKKTATMKVFEESDLDGIQIPEEIEYSIFNQTVVVEASVEAIHKLELLINEKKTKTQQKRKEQSNEAKKAQHKTVPKSLEPKKTVERNDKKSKNQTKNVKTQIQTPTQRELTVYHKDFTDAQYNFVEKYDLSKIVQIYRLNEGQMDRLYDYLIFFGFNPKLQSFYAFLAAVQFYSGEQRLENLVDKLIRVKWDGKPVDATPTTIKLLLVHQYRQVDVLRYKECNIDLLSLIKMLRIMMKEEIFV